MHEPPGVVRKETSTTIPDVGIRLLQSTVVQYYFRGTPTEKNSIKFERIKHYSFCLFLKVGISYITM